MEIQIDPHTLDRAKQRGASLGEIKEVIKSGKLIPARGNRLARAKVFDFKQQRNKHYYEQKRIEVFYLIENGKIITVTVYAFYGKWE